MDLKQQIDQLNDQIIKLEQSLETIKESLKETKKKRLAFLKLEEKAKEIQIGPLVSGWKESK